MKLKIIRATEAIDADMELDEMVNEFCKNVQVIDINCQTEDGETYCYIKYMDKIKSSSGLERLVEDMNYRNYCNEQDAPADSER